ncbi:5-oxoprolinase subunit PxpA [Marinicrinis sediminis]|uniref:5-oxoprolinase subunit A n=1 Tax=Marinicrinis sediminis TaxID=1652465 RepID=A0ABW5R934_9BACL
MRLNIDLNCDLGESFGVYQMGQDADILPWITSANIACAFHAGDPSVMKRTVKACVQHEIHIGAHPGLPDLQGFGRREMQVTAEEVYDMIVYQVGALRAFVQIEGARLHHVKPHGALYNMAARQPELAAAVAAAVYDVDRELVLYGLAGSELIEQGRKRGLRVAREIFADRMYEDDGALTPRSLPGAVIHDAQQAISQVMSILERKEVMSRRGLVVPLEADTVCVHGDNEQALVFVQGLHQGLTEAGLLVKGEK